MVFAYSYGGKFLQEDWEDGGSTNAIAQWWLGREVAKRLQKLQSGETDGSIDILLTGCEVSLWLLEQFASDLGQVFPKLQVFSASCTCVTHRQSADCFCISSRTIHCIFITSQST